MGTLCVVGGGWAGIAAAVHATRLGEEVTLVEMASQLGGRARCLDIDGAVLDNGQHILIGAYRHALDLMRTVGVDVEAVLERRPLELVFPDDTGLTLPRGRPLPALLRGVLGARGWRWPDRWRLLAHATGWAAAGFRCDGLLTVGELCHRMPPRLRAELIDPLCVAALNTPPAEASAAVFLRVLREALIGAPGSADLLLPRGSLGNLLPEPARRWLQASGAQLRLGSRVMNIKPERSGWRVDGQTFDRVVLASTTRETARLCRNISPPWAQAADQMEFEPIVTVYLRSLGTRLRYPMVSLRSDHCAPAQFVFDHGCLGGAEGLFAAVVSGARHWADRGAGATAQAVCEQLDNAFAPGTWSPARAVLRVLVEKRATFLCRPGLVRPGSLIAPNLCAAGDYVDGPYPATLEGAVLSGRQAVQLLYQNTDRVFAMQK